MKLTLDFIIGLTYNIIMEKQIIYYYTVNGKCPYLDWYKHLDKSTRIRIDKRVERLKTGLYGDYKRLKNSELSELRFDFGKGYRIYYCDIGDVLILFIGGSDKKDQKKAIEQCNDFFNDFIERNA